jgi:hypothetical protein
MEHHSAGGPQRNAYAIDPAETEGLDAAGSAAGAAHGPRRGGRGWSGPGAARIILLFHIISARL